MEATYILFFIFVLLACTGTPAVGQPVPPLGAGPSYEMPPQMADEEDPCRKRHSVQMGETCKSVARQYRMKVEDLLMLNPGMACDPFFADVNICVDQGATARVLDDAVAENPSFRLLSREELDHNLANADSQAQEPFEIDTGV